MDAEAAPFRRSLGIMTTRTAGEPPFGSRRFYQRLCVAGQQAGLNVFVFMPQDIDWVKGSVPGFRYDTRNERWSCLSYPLPDAVYDRCFFTQRSQYMTHRTAVRRLQEEHHALFLGCSLRGKWDVQRLLERDGRFAAYLPRTEVMRGMHSVTDWLREHSQLILKPQAGSQGRGVLLVQRTGGTGTLALAAQQPSEDRVQRLLQRAAVKRSAGGSEPLAAQYTVRGRDAHNRSITRGFADAAALLLWLRRFTGQRRYLQQQYLLLQASTGDAYDVRSLVQKNGNGRWQVTGMAVRQGQKGSLTSNLHGGGSVEPVDEFLVKQFPPAQVEAIIQQLHTLSALIPEALEATHGRLVELGLDFGIDTSGQIWILEANSKPGRSILTYVHDTSARVLAITNPIRYARYLLKTQKNNHAPYYQHS